MLHCQSLTASLPLKNDAWKTLAFPIGVAGELFRAQLWEGGTFDFPFIGVPKYVCLQKVIN